MLVQVQALCTTTLVSETLSNHQIRNEKMLILKCLELSVLSILLVTQVHAAYSGGFDPCSAKIFFCMSHGEKVFFNLKSSYISYLTRSASFEYLCYGSTDFYKYKISFSAGTVFIRF